MANPSDAMSFLVLVPKLSEMMSAPRPSLGDNLLHQIGFEHRAELCERAWRTLTSALGAMARTTPATNVPWPA